MDTCCEHNSSMEQQQPRSQWWSANRRYLLSFMLESFIGLITLVFVVLLSPYKSLGQGLQMCVGVVASFTGLAGIFDALWTPRNKFSGFTIAFLVFDLVSFVLSLTSLCVIVVHIYTNNTDSGSYSWFVLILSISEVLADFILVLFSCHFYVTLHRRMHSCFQMETIDDVVNNDEIEMHDVVQHSEMPGIQPPLN